MAVLEIPTKLRGDLICLAAQGGNPCDLLSGSGVSYEDILAQRPIPRELIADLFHRVAVATEPSFGVICGREIRSQYLGLLGYRLSNSETLGELLDYFACHCIEISHPLNCTLSYRGSTWQMSFEARIPMSTHAHRFCVESSLAAFRNAVFGLSGLWIELHSIGFSFPRPQDVEIYSQLGVSEVNFDCATSYVTGSLRDLQRHIPTADPSLRALCDDLCRRSWPARDESTSVADRVRHLLRAHGAVDLSHVSLSMAMSVRSVQRHLTAEGVTFQSLLDDYRYQRAMQLVSARRANKIIAFELGFQDVKSFNRAFGRWTGLSTKAWLSQNS